MNLKAKDIAKAIKGEIIGDGYTEIHKIITDSREADGGSLFIPLCGNSHDGHDFVASAIKNGCRLVLCGREMPYQRDVCYIRVGDTKKAMGDLAAYYLKSINPVKIAVTGSVGKTTTKDMIFAVVEKSKKTLKTLGNFNNDIGLPLTIFRLEDEEAIVLEMGMNHFGEIEYLSKITAPDIGVITNIGHSHMENLGSQAGILKAKMEIIAHMPEDGYLILNADDPMLRSVISSVRKKIITFGIKSADCDYKANIIKSDEKGTIFESDGYEYTLKTLGRHNVYNAMAAVCVGKILNIPAGDIKCALYDYELTKMRQDILEHKGYTVIVDCYNAAPNSVEASLSVLSDFKTKKRKIAVLSSIMELGKARDSLLYDIGMKTKEYGTDILITIGKDAEEIARGAEAAGLEHVLSYPDNDTAKAYIKDMLKEGDVVLVKGSRAYKLEEICEYILDRGELA